jgi:hypothetical protein
MTDETETYRAFFDALPDEGAVEDLVNKAMTRANSTSRPYEFLSLWEAGYFCFKTELLAKSLYREWSGFDRIPHKEFEELLNDSELDRDDFLSHLSTADRAFYDALPDKGIALYRGQDADGEVGLSWTTDRRVADGFAQGHRGISNPRPVVLKTIIPKSLIAFVCTDRNESEVVLWWLPTWTVRKLKARPKQRRRPTSQWPSSGSPRKPG